MTYDQKQNIVFKTQNNLDKSKTISQTPKKFVLEFIYQKKKKHQNTDP